jgi:hypothetical protein
VEAPGFSPVNRVFLYEIVILSEDAPPGVA